MKKINFVTSNTGKIASLKRLLKQHELNIEVVPQKLDLVEPQADTVNDVSRSKAMQAFSILREPVVVEDGGFYIETLGDFPGVYAKYVLDTIGVAGIMKLMDGKENRRARFCSCTSFVDIDGNLLQFENDISENSGGTIVTKKANVSCPHAWSDIWYIYQPNRCDRTLSELTNEELNDYEMSAKNERSSVENFVCWLKNSKLF